VLATVAIRLSGYHTIGLVYAFFDNAKAQIMLLLHLFSTECWH
jgi:hypothetical protein